MPAARTLRLPLLLGLAALGVGWQPPAAVAQADHLLLSEIVMQTRLPVETFGVKFIEIVNPTGAEIDLSDVYLTDATNAPTTIYAKIGTGQDAGGGTSGDFHARFPDGAAIAAGDTIAIAVLGSAGYLQAYGRLPDFELYEDGLAPDGVPELVPAFPGAIGAGLGSGGSNPVDLSTTAESIVLYRWDGQSDLVQDLDYAFWGTVTSVRVDKTGLTVDGPDAGAETSTYLADTAPPSQQAIAAAAHAYDGSFRRNDAAESGETATGGNGATGHDEMGERLATSWASLADQQPPAAGVLTAPAPIFLTATLAPRAPVSGQPTVLETQVLSYNPVTAVELFYRVDGGAFVIVTATLQGSTYRADLPAFAEGAVVDWYLRASAGAATALRPVAAPRYVESFTVSAPGEPHILLSEVSVGPGTEYVEIYNPTGADIALDDYYLTDAIFTGQYYWNIVRPNPSQATVGGGAFADFHARFPAGITLAAGDTLTVAVSGSSGFLEDFGFQPDCELYEDAVSADGVPDMRDVFPGSIVGTDGANVPTLTNPSGTNGEVLILYTWDGQSDLVTDVDVLWWGTLASSHFTKTGVSIDGPDADATPTAYQPDTATGSQLSIGTVPSGTDAYHRLDPLEGDESQNGGNGIGGDDETSENFPATWGVAPRDPAGPTLPEGAGGSVVLKVPGRTFLPKAGQRLPIQFATRARTHTVLRVMDLEGRLVTTLYDSDHDGAASIIAEPGQYTQVQWDGRSDEFELVPPGLYIVHLSSVDRRTGDEENQTAPAVVATRLSD